MLVLDIFKESASLSEQQQCFSGRPSAQTETRVPGEKPVEEFWTENQKDIQGRDWKLYKGKP